LLIRGVQGHVAYPELVDNPIRRFAPVLAELHETRWDDGNAHFPPTSFQVTDIQSGVGAANVTPPELRASFNFRYSSEWSHRALQARVAGILDGHGLDYRLDWQLSGEPFLTEPGLLTAATSAAIKAVCGIETRMSTGGGTSDGRFISPAGADVVELGLMNDSIHMANEYVRIEDVPRLAEIYRQIMERLLT
jgi:succinyl-diaminopimelate desuccinylase